MYEMNESVEPSAGTEPKKSVSRAKILWLNMAISVPVAVIAAIGLSFAFEGLGWNVPAPILGFVCGFGISQIGRIVLERHFERKTRITDV